jgi:hypothetical protein
LAAGIYTVSGPQLGAEWQVVIDQLTPAVPAGGTAEVAIVLTHAAPAQDIVCTLLGDTFVESSVPSKIYGRDSDLEADGRPGSLAEMELRFQCPQNVQLQHATLELWLRKSAEQTANVSMTTGDWDETKTNWQNKPEYGPDVIGTISPREAGRASIPINGIHVAPSGIVNITVWIAENQNYRKAAAFHFASREYHNGEHAARLVFAAH